MICGVGGGTTYSGRYALRYRARVIALWVATKLDRNSESKYVAIVLKATYKKQVLSKKDVSNTNSNDRTAKVAATVT